MSRTSHTVKKHTGARSKNGMPVAHKVLAYIVALTVALAFSAIGAVPDKAQAATRTTSMKGMALKWDLKVGETVKADQKWAGLKAKKKGSARIYDWSVKDYEDDPSYNVLTFKARFTHTAYPTKKQVKTVLKSKSYLRHADCGGNFFLGVADYYTGRDLTFTCHDTGVITNISWTAKNWKSIRYKRGTEISSPKYLVAKVEIRYPKSYKGLCIGVGGTNLSYTTKADKKYQTGRATFNKTSYYRYGKSSTHWMRVK